MKTLIFTILISFLFVEVGEGSNCVVCNDNRHSVEECPAVNTIDLSDTTFSQLLEIRVKVLEQQVSTLNGQIVDCYVEIEKLKKQVEELRKMVKDNRKLITALVNKYTENINISNDRFSALEIMLPQYYKDLLKIAEGNDNP